MPPEQRFLLGASAAGSFGAGIGRTALPLLAVTTFGATPLEVGVLTAAQTVAFIIVGLPAGAIVDRVRKRQTMIAMNLVRLTLSVAVVVLCFAGLIGIGWLIVLVTLMGGATVFFELAALASLAHLAGRDGLLAVNGQLQGISSATSVGAPAAAGGLVMIIGAALTTVGVTVGYAVTAVLLGRMRPHEERAEPRPWHQVWSETGEGLRHTFGTEATRWISVCTAGVNLAHAARAAILVIFLLQLGFGPGEIGVAAAASGIGGVIAAVCSVTPARMPRIWRLLLWSQAAAMLVPLANGELAIVLVCAGMVVSSYGATRYNIAQITFFQQSCPPELLGRVSAANRFLVWATLPAGALLGGVLGACLPVIAVLWLATAASVASAVAGALPLHQMGTRR